MNIQCLIYVYIVIDAKMGELISQPLNELESCTTPGFKEEGSAGVISYVGLGLNDHVGYWGHVTRVFIRTHEYLS